jgi:hypothetical protein
MSDLGLLPMYQVRSLRHVSWPDTQELVERVGLQLGVARTEIVRRSLDWNRTMVIGVCAVRLTLAYLRFSFFLAPSRISKLHGARGSEFQPLAFTSPRRR